MNDASIVPTEHAVGAFQYTSTHGIRTADIDGEGGPVLFINAGTSGEGGDPSGQAGASAVDRALASVERKVQQHNKRIAATGMQPLNVLSATRARIKFLRGEVKRLRRAEKELTQLERLLAAATGKPMAPVRSIDSARRVS